MALQSQLNPHFLHNMLQTIAIMAEEGSPAAIQDLIQNLARVLRYVSSTEATTATLGTEMEYAESYLAAMRARFGESLEYVIDVSRRDEGDRRSPADSAAVHRELLQVRDRLRGLPGASNFAGHCADGRWIDRDSRQRARILRRRPSARFSSGSGTPGARQARCFPHVDLGDGNRQFLREAPACLRRGGGFRDHQPSRRRRADRDGSGGAMAEQQVHLRRRRGRGTDAGLPGPQRPRSWIPTSPASGTAADGEEAVELVERHLPDLLDHRHQDARARAGWSWCERIRRTNPDLRILIVSGYSEFEYARRAIELGVDEYLLKPIDVAALARDAAADPDPA